jgi:hypothetical protein
MYLQVRLRGQVDPDHLVPAGLSGLHRPADAVDADVVVQNVDATKSFDAIRDHVLDFVGDGDIGAKGLRVVEEFLARPDGAARCRRSRGLTTAHPSE